MKTKTIFKKIKSQISTNYFLFFSVILLLFLSKNVSSQNSANDFYLKSIDFVKQNDYSNALTNINKAVEKAPQNHEYLAYKGFIQRNNQNFECALISMEKAIQINSEIGWYYVEAVVSAYEIKNLILAKKYSEKALTFGETNLGKSNYDYVKNIFENLKPCEYILFFKFNPKNPKLVYEKDNTLCIPLPSSDLPYQKTTYKITGATLIKSDKTQDFELIYLKPIGNQDVSIKCTIIKTPFSYSEEIKKANSNIPIPENIKPYLKSSFRLDLNSEIVTKIAKQLKGNSILETVKNTINWLNETKKYEKAPTWNKVSDIISANIMECATGSLEVIALLRANGIPARQIWGPIDAGRNYSPENYLKGHVWFEFYLSGVGWIPVEQFDISSIGFLPISYIRMMTNQDHLFDNIPLGNIMTIMNNEQYGDIVEYTKSCDF